MKFKINLLSVNDGPIGPTHIWYSSPIHPENRLEVSAPLKLDCETLLNHR